MATVKLDFKNLDALTKEKIVNKRFQRGLGEALRKAVLDLVAIGKSPVKGQGRFKAYAADRKAAPFRQRASRASKLQLSESASRARGRAKELSKKSSLYPNSVKKKFPRKRKRPVNLELSSKMLKFINWKRKTGGIKFGLISAPSEIKDIFESHNDGTNEKRNVPRRAVIPSRNGEMFAVSIQQLVRKKYLARIRQLLGRNNQVR